MRENIRTSIPVDMLEPLISAINHIYRETNFYNDQNFSNQERFAVAFFVRRLERIWSDYQERELMRNVRNES